MNLAYSIGRACCRFIGFSCIRYVVLHPERAQSEGGFILACSHLSHLEPIIVATVVSRHIDWMARLEFYRHRTLAAMLHLMRAFPVNRQGIPVRAIRTAIERARAGRIVGIFPEGGVLRGNDSILRGGAFKKGVCVVSYRSQKPVVPVVVVGTEQLNRVGPWLPFRRARVWMIVGHPIQPRVDEPSRRVARELMAGDIASQFQSLYRELCATCRLDPDQAGA